MHGHGAVLCSACSGIFLLAESGLFNGRDTTVHFVYANMFASVDPTVPIHPERVLVVSGEREELVTSGASMSWHDLVLDQDFARKSLAFMPCHYPQFCKPLKT